MSDLEALRRLADAALGLGRPAKRCLSSNFAARTVV